MNRNSIILITFFFIIIAVAGVVFLLRPATPPTPVQQGSTTPVNNSYTTGTGAQSKEEARAAYQKALSASGYPDNIKPGATVFAGEYALQTWRGDHTGGEALLKFDTSNNKWTIVDPGGGAWSLYGLVGVGVPTSTAQTLLAGIGR